MQDSISNRRSDTGYRITEVDGEKHADDINRFNALFPDDFPPLKPRHLAKGFWWLVHDDIKLIGFAGLVPFAPFDQHYGYLKRSLTHPS